jgi:hypothetical protein
VLIALALLLSSSPAVFATKPADAIASGWVVSVDVDEMPDAEEIEIAVGDQVRHQKYVTEEDVAMGGAVVYPKGGTYNAFQLTRDGAGVWIVWSGVDDAVLWNLDQAVTAVGKENVAIRPGDRVEVRVKRNDEGEMRVTLDVFRGKPSIAWFAFPLG